MKKAKASKSKAKRSVKRPTKSRKGPKMAVRRPARRPVIRAAARTKTTRVSTPPVKSSAGSAAKMAARVMANRSAKQEQLALREKPALKNVALAPQPVKPRSQRRQPTRSARPGSATTGVNRQVVRMSRVPQFAYMKAPGADTGFDVGDTVEVFCDHERESERVRGWIKGVVVQIDNKLVAVQFRSNVFLTDGWMVPDRILWYSVGSDQIRAATIGKKGSRKVIPDY